MAEKSPILQALELNTKAIQGLHKGLEGDRKTKPSGGGGADGGKKEDDGKPKEIKEVKGIGTHAKEEIAQRKKTVKTFIGDKVHKTSEFVKGDFLRKIPILDKMGGNFIADILKRKRDDKRRFKKEQKEEEQRAKDEEDNEEKRYLATQARAAGKSKFKYEGEEYDESDFKEEEEERQESDSESISDQEGLLATLVSLAQQTNRLLIEGLGVRSPGYLHDLLNLSKGDKLKDREELLEKKKDKKEKKEEKKKLGMTAKGMDFLGRGVKGMVGFLTNTMFPALGSMLAGLGAVIVPILSVVLVAAAAAGLGYSIYKLFVEPWMDRMEEKYNVASNEVSTVSPPEQSKVQVGLNKWEPAYEIPKGHPMFGEQDVISESKAREWAKTQGSTLEEMVSSGDISPRNFQRNKFSGDVQWGEEFYYQDENVMNAATELNRMGVSNRPEGMDARTRYVELMEQKMAERLVRMSERFWKEKDAIKRGIIYGDIVNAYRLINSPGAFSPEARDRFIEGFPILKFIEYGRVEDPIAKLTNWIGHGVGAWHQQWARGVDSADLHDGESWGGENAHWRTDPITYDFEGRGPLGARQDFEEQDIPYTPPYQRGGRMPPSMSDISNMATMRVIDEGANAKLEQLLGPSNTPPVQVVGGNTTAITNNSNSTFTSQPVHNPEPTAANAERGNLLPN